MTLRRADPSHFKGLMNLEEACFRPEKRDSPSAMSASLKNPRHEVWIATDKRSIVGSLFLRKLRRSVRIQSIAVAPSHQGRGLGTQLMRQSIKRARNAGVDHITLEADASNPSLTSWYQHLGFRKVATLPDYYADGRHAIRMRLTLTT